MMTSKSKSATNQQAQVLTIGTHTNKNACSTKRRQRGGPNSAVQQQQQTQQ